MIVFQKSEFNFFFCLLTFILPFRYILFRATCPCPSIEVYCFFRSTQLFFFHFIILIFRSKNIPFKIKWKG